MNGRIRVGVNLLWLVPGVVGGTEDAAVGLFSALGAYDDEVELVLYAQDAFVEAHPALAAAHRCHAIGLPRGSKAARVMAESTWLAARARLDRVDVLHCYGGVVPLLAPRPTVLTLHDVQPLERPESFSTAKSQWLARMIPRSVAAAEVVVVPSAYVRSRVMDLLDVDGSRVRLLSHGVSRHHGDVDQADVLDVDEVRGRFGLRGPVVLYPAITYAHKNHQVLLEACAMLRDRGTPVTLVLTGGAGPVDDDVRATVERLGIGSLVRRVGRVSYPELDGLYRAATALAFPSRYEGFGLPVLEAMYAGCPVVAADATALPEVVGDAGLLVDADDVSGWADALASIVTNADFRQTLVEAGVDRALTLEWVNLAPLMIDMYRTAIDQHSARHRRGVA